MHIFISCICLRLDHAAAIENYKLWCTMPIKSRDKKEDNMAQTTIAHVTMKAIINMHLYIISHLLSRNDGLCSDVPCTFDNKAGKFSCGLADISTYSLRSRDA